jgi:hypothetical protein
MLLRVHRVLIFSAIALAVLFALRALVLFGHDGQRTNLALGLASLAVAAGLVAYARRLRPDAGGGSR